MFIQDQENTGSLPKTIKMFFTEGFTSNTENVKKIRDVPGLWQDVVPIF